MTRNKVKFAFIENSTARKASYKKRTKGFLKKAYELGILCDVEMAIVVYSPYHDGPNVFPNHNDVANIFTTFMELPELARDMVTQEELTKGRIKKLEDELCKIRKKNRIIELANTIYDDMLNEKNIHVLNMHPYDLNDLSYVINQNLKQVVEAIRMKVEEEGGSTLNAPQPITRLMVLNSEGPRAPLLAHGVAPLDPPTVPSMIPSATLNMQVTQSSVFPLMTPPQTVPLVDSSGVYSPPSYPPLSFSSQIFPPQMNPQIHLQTDLTRPPGMAHSIPSTTMAIPPMSAPVFPQMTSQVDSSMDISEIDALMSMNNYQNYFADFSQSPTFSKTQNWNNDDIMALFDDSSFNIINSQDPNLNNKF